MKKEQILENVKKELIYNRLKLNEIGVKLEEITDNIPLFENDGLALNSVDALELAMGIQKEYDVKIVKLDEQMIRENFKTPSKIADYIIELLAAKEKR